MRRQQGPAALLDAEPERHRPKQACAGLDRRIVVSDQLQVAGDEVSRERALAGAAEAAQQGSAGWPRHPGAVQHRQPFALRPTGEHQVAQSLATGDHQVVGREQLLAVDVEQIGSALPVDLDAGRTDGVIGRGARGSAT